MDELTVISALLTVAATINIFFIRRLVVKIDKIDSIDKKLSEYHIKYSEQIKVIQEQISHLSRQVQDVSDLRADVAVLKFAITGKSSLSKMKSSLKRGE